MTLEPEVDPSVLTAPYGGKLTRLFVEDGAHVDKGTPFAEVEVMKMLFPLHASEAGHITLAKVPGALINAGEVLARLQLDDPNIVAKAAPFQGELGDFEPPIEMGNAGPPHVQLRYLEARCNSACNPTHQSAALRAQQPHASQPETLHAQPKILRASLYACVPSLHAFAPRRACTTCSTATSTMRTRCSSSLAPSSPMPA